MASFTIFFCGTSSNSYDFANTNYFQGELISTLARHHTGSEFIDWIIVDGPGSGNHQEAEKWVPSGNYSTLRGTLSGKGWNENVKHAIAVLLGVDFHDRGEHTSEERKRLQSMGIGTDQPLHPRISPQSLQQKKIEIQCKGKKFHCVNLVGWSRGGVTCHMMANAMLDVPKLRGLPVNIFAADPVPGYGNMDQQRISLGANVKTYLGVYSQHERSRGFSPVLPRLADSTKRFITLMPGRHGTLVGNAANDGSSGMNTLFAPGKVTRDLAEQQLVQWDTPLHDTLDLSPRQVLTEYEKMWAQMPQFNAMTSKSYTWFTQSGSRSVGQGNGKYTSFDKITELQTDPAFVNAHHRLVFQEVFPNLYEHFFCGRKKPDAQINPSLKSLTLEFPKTWQNISVSLQQRAA